MRKGVLSHHSKRFLCLTIATAMLSCLVLPTIAAAEFIRSTGTTSDEAAWIDLSTLQAELENELIQEKLEQLGLSPEEVQARVDSLTPEQRDAVVQQLEATQAGGAETVTMSWVVLLLILILVVIAT